MKRDNENNNERYINIEFDCYGTEKSISECPNRVSLQPCESSSPAGVTCLSQSVELKNNNNNERGSSAGALFVGGVPVCGSKWTRSMSLAICQLVDGPSAGVAKTEYREMTESATLGLDGVMKRDAEGRRFMDCDVDVTNGKDGRCPSQNQPWIVCSPCSYSAIHDRTKKAIKAARSKDNNIDQVKEVFKESKDWLVTKCRSECAVKVPFGVDCDKCFAENNCTHWKNRVGLWCKLREQGNPECTFHLALEMMLMQLGRVANESRPDQLMMLKGSDDFSLVAGVEWPELGYYVYKRTAYAFRVVPHLLALMEFWSFIDGNPKFQPLWLNRTAKFDKLLEKQKRFLTIVEERFLLQKHKDEMGCEAPTPKYQ